MKAAKKKTEKRSPMRALAPLEVQAPADGKCMARVRGGRAYCRHPAGYRTEHVGQGRCYLHGGLTPITHGRYTSINRTRIGELIEKHAADPDPLDILPELAAARGLFEDFIERYDVMSAALQAWHTSYVGRARPLPEDRLLVLSSVLDEYEALGENLSDKQLTNLELARGIVADLRRQDDGKPTQILDIAEAHRILSEITKIAERIEKIRSANAISRPDLARLMHEMGRAVVTYVKDEAIQQKISDAWLSVRV